MEKVLVVNDGSIMSPFLRSLIYSKFEVQEVMDANQALDTLRTNQLQGRGFDLVISYAHKCQRDATALKTFINREFQQQLPIVCVKCISEAVECFDELNGMLARDLIHKWKSNTVQKACQKNWTKERNFNFFSVVESLESRGHDVKPTTVLNAMSANERGLDLTLKHVNSHLQEISNGFPMDISYNGSVPPEAWPEYSPFASQQPYVQAMPSISPAPSQQINNNSQFHDIVGTSQQSLNQDYPIPPSQFGDVDWDSIDFHLPKS